MLPLNHPMRRTVQHRHALSSGRTRLIRTQVNCFFFVIIIRSNRELRDRRLVTCEVLDHDLAVRVLEHPGVRKGDLSGPVRPAVWDFDGSVVRYIADCILTRIGELPGVRRSVEPPDEAVIPVVILECPCRLRTECLSPH